MSYAGFTKFLLVVGFLSLLHAAYSAAQRKHALLIYSERKIINDVLSNLDRTYLRDTDQEKTNTFLPLDVSKSPKI